MIIYVQSNLFTSPAQVLVNTVNTVGVMGKGLARIFREVYPEMFEEYRRRCECHEIAPGVLQLVRTPHKSILNFPTKRHWRQRSRLDDIEAGLETFVATYARHGLTSVGFPQLGCGNGGLDWEGQVRPLMERHLAPLPIDCYVHVVPSGPALSQSGWDEERIRVWLRGEPAVVSFSAFSADLTKVIERMPSSGWRIASSDESPDAGLRRSDEAERGTIPVVLLGDLWRRLCRFGLIGIGDLPVNLHDHAETLFACIAELPYVERAVWATDWAEFGTAHTSGLLHVPPLLDSSDDFAIPRQPRLFAEMAIA